MSVAEQNEASFVRLDAVIEALDAGDLGAAIEVVVTGEPERERVLREVWMALASERDAQS